MTFFLSFITVTYLFTCHGSDNKSENHLAYSNQVINNKDEKFTEFIYEFVTDSIFQMSRIRFPLEKIIYKDAEYDETEIQLITEKEWKHIILFFDMDYQLQLYDNFDCKLRNSDERVYAYEGVENGINIKYYFKKIKSKWYLIKMEDLST